MINSEIIFSQSERPCRLLAFECHHFYEIEKGLSECQSYESSRPNNRIFPPVSIINEANKKSQQVFDEFPRIRMEM